MLVGEIQIQRIGKRKGKNRIQIFAECYAPLNQNMSGYQFLVMTLKYYKFVIKENISNC